VSDVVVGPSDPLGNAEQGKEADNNHLRQNRHRFRRALPFLDWPRRWWAAGEPTRRTANATALLAFSTLVLAAINIGLLVEARHAARDTKKAIDATNRLANAAEQYATEAKILAASAKRSVTLAETSQRAWIAPINFRLVDLADTDDPLKVRVTYQNVGREPAKNVRNWTATGFIPLSPVITDRWIELGSWYTAPNVQAKVICSRVGDTKNAGVVYPSATSAMSVDTVKYSVDKNIAASLGISPNIPLPVDDIKAAKAVYFVIGCFSYDTLSITRYSSFCAFLNPAGGGKDISQWAFSSCPVGNDDW
jgi:hypothetical protein